MHAFYRDLSNLLRLSFENITVIALCLWFMHYGL